MTEEGGIKIKISSSEPKYRRQKLQIRAKKSQKLVLVGGVPNPGRMSLYLQMGHTDKESFHAQDSESFTEPLGECPKAPSVE